jgi:hypothetical protein
MPRMQVFHTGNFYGATFLNKKIDGQKNSRVRRIVTM